MDKRHSVKVDTEGVRPVMTMAGIMPGGSEMRHWADHVPFPNPDAIARRLAAGNARSAADRARQAQVSAASRRQMELGTCFRPRGTCMYEYACVRCPFLQVDKAALHRLLEIEAETEAQLAKARAHGWDGEVVALSDTLGYIVEKRLQAALAGTR